MIKSVAKFVVVAEVAVVVVVVVVVVVQIDLTESLPFELIWRDDWCMMADC